MKISNNFNSQMVPHVGRLIENDIKQTTNFTKPLVAQKLRMSVTLFEKKLATNFFSDIHDLVKISSFLKKDYIGPAIKVIKSYGLEPKSLYEEPKLIFEKLQNIQEDRMKLRQGSN